MFLQRHFVISTRHGPQRELEKGDRVNVYGQDGHQFSATVIFYDDGQDFVLMETSTKPEYLPQAGPLTGGQDYILLVSYSF